MNAEELYDWTYRYEPHEKNFRPKEPPEVRVALLDEHLKPFEKLKKKDVAALFKKSGASLAVVDTAWTRLQHAFRLRGEILRRMGKADEALASFEKCVALGGPAAPPEAAVEKPAAAKAKKAKKPAKPVAFTEVLGEPSTLAITEAMKTSLSPGPWQALAFDWSTVKGPARSRLIEAFGDAAFRVAKGALTPFAIVGGEEPTRSLVDLLDQQLDAILCYDTSRSVFAIDEGTLTKWRAKLDALEFTPIGDA